MSPQKGQDMSDDPKPVDEPTTEAVERASKAAERAAAASGAAEPDTTDMDATGDDGQVFGG
jgi:hypothetical protein